jgi:hypothetical protein
MGDTSVAALDGLRELPSRTSPDGAHGSQDKEVTDA